MSEPKKPWEETWQHWTRGRSGVVIRVDEPGRITQVCDSWRAPGMSDEELLAAAGLIAAAPEMYRALLACEWVWKGDGGDWSPTCPLCLANTHKEDCLLFAALKKARGE